MIIRIQCTDQVGLVATITQVLEKRHLNIVNMREHVDVAAGLFFIRLQTTLDAHSDDLKAALAEKLPLLASIAVIPEPQKQIVVMVSKEFHCLGDMLIRNHYGTLGAQIVAVIGNHPLLQDICNKFNVPFIWESHEDKTKPEYEANMLQHLQGMQFDYLILAKYMRILSPEFVVQFGFKIINIHHSFLPAFIGANPYKQAFIRGVKLIGATAHFVTNHLDEGPIIAQQIIPVNHAHNATDMMRAGKEIEQAVLAKALQLVLDDRVFVYNNRTVVFE